MRRRNQAAVLLMLCGLALLWRFFRATVMHSSWENIYEGTDTRFDAILFGCVLGIVVGSHLVAAERIIVDPNRARGESTVPVVEDKGTLTFESVEQARFRFNGVIGDRIDAGVDHWLLPAPHANPGMLEMFRLRDRQPAPRLVPWAGEFVGKYLISAIQTLRLSSNPALRKQVASLVRELIASQADDGYLGPFPTSVRLKGNWDLWGHYHCIQALMMWYEATGETTALIACRRAGDLICARFWISRCGF
jgi:hypothetical protein